MHRNLEAPSSSLSVSVDPCKPYLSYFAEVIFSDRYYGQSSPFESLTSKTLQYLTIENAIQDAIHFAKNAKLPFDRLGGSNADSAVRLYISKEKIRKALTSR